MASGTFTAYDKKQAGVYFNRKVLKRQNVNQAPEGIVVYPFVNADWGERNKIIEISSLNECFEKLGYYQSDEKMRPIVEMFRGSNRTNGANKVYVVIPNVATETKASATIGDLTIQAKNVGARGNKITIVMQPNLDTEYDDTNHLYAVYKVQTLVDGVVVSTQTCGEFTDADHYVAAKYSDLKDNNFVKYVYEAADKDTLLTTTAGTTLTGGNTSTPTDAEISTILDVIDGKFFNILCYDGSSTTLKNAFETFINRQWDEKGYFCQLCTSNYTSNFEGVISLQNGMYLSDGYHLDKEKATWWYAGCSAGAKYNESLTHCQHPLAIDTDKEYTSQELDDFIDNGQVAFIKEFDIVMVSKDINTLHIFTNDKGQDLQSNRLLRVLNEICNYCNYQYNINYIGNLPNDDNGRNVIKGNILGKLRDMEANDGIQNLEPEDVSVEPLESDLEAILMQIAIQGVGAIEKIYIRLTSN